MASIGAVTCWAPTSLLGQEILQDTTSGLKSARHRVSTEYALTHQRDTANDGISLEENPYPSSTRVSIPILITPDNPSGYDKLAFPQSEAAEAVASTSSTSPPQKTLQIRHSDSFDGSSYADSSEDSEDEIASQAERKRHSRTLSYDIPGHRDMGVGASIVNRLEDSESGLQDEVSFLSAGMIEGSARTADQAGAILGIANVWVLQLADSLGLERII